MLKSILKLDGVKVLSKENQKQISGGHPVQPNPFCCDGYPSVASPMHVCINQPWATEICNGVCHWCI